MVWRFFSSPLLSPLLVFVSPARRPPPKLAQAPCPITPPPNSISLLPHPTHILSCGTLSAGLVPPVCVCCTPSAPPPPPCPGPAPGRLGFIFPAHPKQSGSRLDSTRLDYTTLDPLLLLPSLDSQPSTSTSTSTSTPISTNSQQVSSCLLAHPTLLHSCTLSTTSPRPAAKKQLMDPGPEEERTRPRDHEQSCFDILIKKQEKRPTALALLVHDTAQHSTAAFFLATLVDEVEIRLASPHD